LECSRVRRWLPPESTAAIPIGELVRGSRLTPVRLLHPCRTFLPAARPSKPSLPRPLAASSAWVVVAGHTASTMRLMDSLTDVSSYAREASLLACVGGTSTSRRPWPCTLKDRRRMVSDRHDLQGSGAGKAEGRGTRGVLRTVPPSPS
jgi:hypothetical protein